MTTHRMLYGVVAAGLFLLLASPAGAVPVRWALTEVEFDDAATASGSFIYDADIDAFSSVAVSVSGGALAPRDYADLRFGSVFDALLVMSPSADLTEMPALQLIFQSPLTNTGGIVDLASFDPFSTSFEQTCLDTACSAAAIERTVISGGLIGTVVPLPGGLALLASALGMSSLVSRRRRAPA